MENVKKGIGELVGSTPLVEIGGFCDMLGAGTRILAKLESFNPAGSAKDRVARALLDDAEARGLLKPGGTVIEPTSGNTGIGLAAAAAPRGYKVILTMPETMSPERVALLKAFNAKVVLTPGALGMQGSIDEARRIAAETPGAFIPDQFSNPANAAAHYGTTGPEIFADLGRAPDFFVAGVGTGGTLTGTGRFLKEKDANVKLVAVEPADSPLLSQGRAGAHKLQGIGANFVPAVLDRSLIDEIITVTTDEAYCCCRAMAAAEGLLVGVSSGAALAAAVKLSNRPENDGKTIVALLPDGGERYMSVGIFGDEQ